AISHLNQRANVGLCGNMSLADTSGYHGYKSTYYTLLLFITMFGTRTSAFLKLSRRDLKYDLPASVVVFLVALPLCLGIALASGAPLFAGLLTGIIGGIVVASLSGSQLSVSGPAAGLTVIVLGAIEQLGAFETFLLAVLLAGL